MKNIARLTSTLLGLLLLVGLTAQIARADDGIFPPAPAAAPYINFDGRGFLLNGKRTFLASGGMEYCRVPRALWRDRLLRLKRAGFNTVEIYNMWNFHEPKKGQFDFSGDHDLDAFLKLVKAMDLYAVVRVGPYVCAEWDSGGYPVWLRFEPGVRVREDNPQFLADVDRYWEKLIPIVAANQINKGGAVIMVQLENEHPQGWGTEMPNAYFTHLRDKAVSLGLQVPYFFSGLHHGSDPAGDNPWSSAGRTNPWYTTEFWSVWYDKYNQTEADARTYDRRMWKVLAYGGNGLNFYMLHGGTNFATWNDDEDTSSYDYGAAIGQAGDLRPTFYRFKRAALFARSFASVLEDSDNATDAYKNAATDSGIRVTARTSPAGTILFLDNNGKEAVRTQVKEADGTLFPSAQALTVTPGQIIPIVRDYALLPGVTLERSTPLLGIQTQGSLTTLVAYGPPGDVAELRFRLTTPATDVPAGITKGDDNTLTLRDPITPSSTGWFTFHVGAKTIRVLAMSTGTADHTWFVDNQVIVGPSYVGDQAATNGKVTLTEESKDGILPLGALYGLDSAAPHLLVPAPTPVVLPAAPTLSDWQMRRGDAEAQTDYKDAAWPASADPLPMGADGNDGAYAWYRTTVVAPKAGTYSLRLTEAGDWLSVFVGGRHAVSGSARRPISLTLPAGPSPLAVLTAHYGRPKLFGFLGPINTVDIKGLGGPVVLAVGSSQGQTITTWRVKNDNMPDRATPPTDTAGADWRDAKVGEDVFSHQRGFAWYRTMLPALPGARRRLHFEDVDDNATVYLNGKPLATHEGYGRPFDVPLDAAWNDAGPNELAVLVENTDGTGGISGPVSLETVAAGDETPIQGWKMRGGIDDASRARWTAPTGGTADGAPAFYRATFDTTPPGETGPHPILRVATTGLSHGFVWLNGHNLGRYPEKIPVDGLYLPECWQKAGRNELMIFDEEGHSPAQVKLWVEQAASRVVVPMTER